MSTDPQVRSQLARAFDAAPPSWSVTLHREAPPDADVLVAGPELDIDADVTFDPTSPLDLVARIEAVARHERGRLVYVVGVTGGCGATTLAVHLAALSGGCVVEGAPGDVRRRLALSEARSWPTPDEPVQAGAIPVPPGCRVLLAPDGASISDAHLTAAAAASVFDHVFVDTGASDLDLGSIPRSALTVILMTPTRPSAERARDVALALPGRAAIVSNRTGPGSELPRRGIEAILEHPIAIELPCSAALRDAEDRGTVVTSPVSRWVWQVRRLWHALVSA